MVDRAVPPPDIDPFQFFTRWIRDSVEADASRRARLSATRATLQFELTGDGGGTFTVRVQEGSVSGWAGGALQPDLRIRLDVETWRALNSGVLSAPQALLRRRLHLRGDLALALKLHLILG